MVQLAGLQKCQTALQDQKMVEAFTHNAQAIALRHIQSLDQTAYGDSIISLLLAVNVVLLHASLQNCIHGGSSAHQLSMKRFLI